MRFIKALTAIAFGLTALTGIAAPGNFVEGTDYRLLAKQQQTDGGKKIEVTEFFWYACSHCFAFEPSLAEWTKKNKDKISFKRVPVVFRDSFIPQQKMYYALEALGKTEELHGKIFNAIHVGKQRLDTDEAIADFVANQGIDKAKFLDAYNSFGVQTKVKRVPQLQQGYQIDGVPMIAVDGRFLTAPSIVGTTHKLSEPALHAMTIDVMTFLVAKAEREPAGELKPPAPKGSGNTAAKK